MSKKSKFGSCEMCKREMELTFHHLIPRTLHSVKWFKKNFTKEEMNSGIDVCPDCHMTIHKTHSEKELGRNYNTLEKLMADPEIAKFVEWISKRG